MSRSLSWIDQQKLGSLLEELGHQTKSESATSFTEESSRSGSYPHGTFSFEEKECVFDSYAKGHTQPVLVVSEETPQTKVVEKKAEAETFSDFAVILQAEQQWKERGVLPFDTSSLSFAVGLTAFIEWLVTVSKGHGAFLADQEGLPLALFETKQWMAALGSSFAIAEQVLQVAGASSSPSPSETRRLRQISIPLSSDEIWHIGWVQSDFGLVSWGLCSSSSLPVFITESISSLLVGVLDTLTIH